MIKHFALIFIFGGLGTTLRALIYLGLRFPALPFWFPTLLVNIIGCTVFFLIERNLPLFSDSMVVYLRTGLLAAFTTFSALSYEVVKLLLSGAKLEALVVVFLNVIFGVVVGIWILR